MLLSLKKSYNKIYIIKFTFPVPFAGIGFSVIYGLFCIHKPIWEGKKASCSIICRMPYVIEYIRVIFFKRWSMENIVPVLLLHSLLWLSSYVSTYRSSLFFSSSKMEFHCLDIAQFNHSSVEAYLDYLHLFAVTSYAAINARVYVFWEIYA